MKKIKPLMAFSLAATMLMAGCSSNPGTEPASPQPGSSSNTTTSPAPNKPDTSKEVKLKMYLIGEAPKDLGIVYDEINKIMKREINATVEPIFLSWGDYTQKYPLLFATGEDFDLVFSADWVKYGAQASKGAYLELTPDMLNKYMPQTMKEMPQEAWEQAKVKSKIYMVPASTKEFSHSVVVVRGDLREKYNIPALKTIDDFEKYLDSVAKNEPNLVPYDESANGYSIFDFFVSTEFTPKFIISNSMVTVDLKDKSGKLVDIAQTPQYLEFAKKMAEWSKKGYWTKNAMVNKTPIKDSFLAGKSASMGGNVVNGGLTVTTANQKNPEWKAEMYDLYNGKATFVNPYIGNGMSINANSKNPERAMMALDLIRNNEDIFNLASYGIKGKHYELTADKKVQTLGGSDSGFKVDSASPFGWRTPLMVKPLINEPKQVAEIKAAWTKTAVTNPLINFVFDTTNVQNELAAIKNVRDQYMLPITFGVTNDPVEAINTLNAKFKEAGLDKVKAEAQKQIDEYLKNNK
ncbi:putative aldouronate transport system substrate-binding protein [Paenibacillus sp. UNCCL117]|uniref:extracellular solute-binding protein n=1 Tax=unclassified Paenibacillus TaxID=185978 RepID=UPI000890B5E4|nr:MULTISPECIES: extracellular solute-binding protein [unclassified Paenibacillus]SDD50775.1 putative aldouronate transport system substrate-binding protein [Paenibacillus sp. cl123]SFW49663.1 putative aldouronate transport system substrate-binding protein [Paenibacillus sp. UNCCL117]